MYSLGNLEAATPDASPTITLTNYTLRCPSVGELLGKAAESIFFMYGDRPATGCYSDRGQLLVPLVLDSCYSLALSLPAFLHHINIFTLENSIGCFSRIPSTWYPPWWEDDPRGEAPADNLDIAQASFELP